MRVPSTRVMYPTRDAAVVDYAPWFPEGIPFTFRGPRPSAVDGAIVCIGSAHTYGCFVERPYPALVGEALGRPVVNLGKGGVGPRWFVDRPELVDLANRGSVVVIQVMSGRTEAVPPFTSDGFHLWWLDQPGGGRQVSASEAVAAIVRASSPADVATLLGEIRARWVRSSLELFRAITRPKVLLWLSTRKPAYRPRIRQGMDPHAVQQALFGGFPELVDERMIDALAPHVEACVEVVSEEGLPQPLVDRQTGRPAQVYHPEAGEWRGYNTYYPSPAMHVAAAEALVPVVRRLVASSAR